ncbi:cysteine desulfurase sulfur acceptor subunit CsdE [Vibrio sp. SM6]|uniref:Cysteine desulfurase sulfur acceptor subunit CsdE n=1 Tax=Vibrio agarilyticus TaxID=2726741 RepID=A0A7X8TQR6_9VIBR|nr:cysteine desulfurase sulfur acceptor subunit CsdE [Vibrio agarilyticus]NLS13113.1 cysteine desulfurase sulfur acceptor subunit CsdE [Vibrio agarilyticus]
MSSVSLFGHQITSDTVIAEMTQCQGWEARYRAVIQLGKQLPVMSETEKNAQLTVAGCESKVWLSGALEEGVWHFSADSDARIVRGLIALVMAAYNGKSASAILAFDVDHYFEQLGLLSHLSPSRGNGLKAIVEQIRTMVSTE